MSKIQDELQKKNKEIIKLIEYFYENFNKDGATILRDLKSISARLVEMMIKDAKNESG